MLWAGNGFERKGGEDTIKAFMRLREMDPEYELYMVGVDQPIELPHVHVLPFLHGTEYGKLDDLYRRARMFVLPSYREPFGLVYLEAMARKTPIIVSTRCGMAEIVRRTDCGKIVRPGRIDEIAEAMCDIAAQDELFVKYSERGYRFADQNARWDVAAERMVDAMERWMNGQKVPEDYNDYS